MKKLRGVAVRLIAGQSQSLQRVSIGEANAVADDMDPSDWLQFETLSIRLRAGDRPGLSMRSFFSSKRDLAYAETALGSPVVSLEAFDSKNIAQAIPNFAFFLTPTGKQYQPEFLTSAAPMHLEACVRPCRAASVNACSETFAPTRSHSI